MKPIIYIFIGLFIFFCREYAFAQCCSAGNPTSTNCSISSGGKNKLNVAYSQIYSTSDTYYNGTEELPDKKYIESYFDFSSLSVSYGLTDKLRVSADIGYFFNKSEHFVIDDYLRYAHGIADASFGLTYSTYKTDDNLFELMQSAKITIPVGKFNQVYDDILLPIDLQPTSGSYKYNLGLIMTKRFKNSNISLMSVNTVEISQLIENERTHYKYGNLYNFSLAGIYRATDYLTGLIQLRCEIRDKALNGYIPKEDNTYVFSYVNASGGILAFISPQVNITLLKDLAISLQYNQPVYKNVNGEQLTNKYSLNAGISKSFDFNGGRAELQDEHIMDNSMSKINLNVRGNCDMCKARIEGVTEKFKNVVSSEWNPETKSLTIYYKTELPDIDGIAKALAAAGHDTDKYKADKEVYEKLPKCCLYRDK